MWSVWLVFCDCGFHSVHHLMDEDKRLTELPDGRDWPWDNLVLFWWWGHGSAVACCRVGGTECSSACMGPFEVGCHYLHYLHHSLVSGQTTGQEHSPTHQQKIALKIYQAWPCPSEQDPVSPSVSLSHQATSITLICLSLRRQTEWKPHSQETKQTDHMDHSLV